MLNDLHEVFEHRASSFVGDDGRGEIPQHVWTRRLDCVNVSVAHQQTNGATRYLVMVINTGCGGSLTTSTSNLLLSFSKMKVVAAGVVVRVVAFLRLLLSVFVSSSSLHSDPQEAHGWAR